MRKEHEESVLARMESVSIVQSFKKGRTISDLARDYTVGRNIISDIVQADFSLKLRKWKPSEKEAVLCLREEGLGPLAIHRKTGYPIDQIKFWVYGSRTRRILPKKPRSSGANASSRAYYRQKFGSFTQWKATTLRSGFLSRAKKLGVDIASVPTRVEIEMFIDGKDVCFYCKKLLTDEDISVDHAQPVSRGGDFGIDNLRVCCKGCNGAKNSMNEQEYIALLKLLEGFDEVTKRSVLARLRAGASFMTRK